MVFRTVKCPMGASAFIFSCTRVEILGLSRSNDVFFADLEP